ncbi:AAA family ATPase [Nitrincola sp.]|uniref:AAA family ATPase n=1 Tax=Nitrincola sp. TaxID=1926584 RepID=UPI003A8E71E4
MPISEHEYAEPASRMQLAEKLSHLSSYSEFMILLLGDAGSGRSLLLDQLSRLHEPRTQRIARIDLDEKTDVSGLLLLLITALRLESDALIDNRKRLAAIHKHIRALAEVDISLHLHIDNADYLSDNALELLLSLLQLGDSAPHLLLTALPDFEQRAEDKGVFERFESRVHIQRLEPFTEVEAEDFVLALLPAQADLSPKQLRKLIDAGDGHPGSLKAAVAALVQQGGLESQVRSFPLPPLHMGAIALVLLLITGFAVWHYLPKTEHEPQGIARIQVAPTPVSANTEPVVRVDVIEAREELAQRLAEQEALLSAAEEPSIEEDDQVSPTTEQISESEADPVVEVSETAEVDAVAEVVELEEVNLAEETSAVTEVNTVTADAVAEVEPEPAPAPVLPEVEAPVVADTPEPIEQSAVVSAPESASEPAPARTEPELSTSVTPGSQAEVLLEWPDSGFTLQMLGARSEESVVKFIQSQEQPQRFYRFKALFQGAPWHVVVYGQYPTRAAAMEAVRSLPADLRDRNPWARSISSVKEDIKKIDQ